MREIMLIIHFLGLAMGLGTSFAFLFLGRAGAKLDKSEAAKFMFNASSLSTMGHIGLGLLFISGGYLMTPYWKTLGDNPMLIAKLSLFVILGALIGMMSARMRRAKANQDPAALGAVAKMGPITLLITIAIVVLAVYIFH